MHVKYWMRNYHFEGSFPNFPNRDRYTRDMSTLEKVKIAFYNKYIRLKRRYSSNEQTVGRLSEQASIHRQPKHWLCTMQCAVCTFGFLVTRSIFECTLKQNSSFLEKGIMTLDWIGLCCMHALCIRTATACSLFLPIMWMGAWSVCKMHAR